MTETAEAPENGTDDLMEKVVRLCRHRGFIFPSAEIYGGFRSTYDYGPLGVNMLRNVKNAWWRAMVQERDDVVGLDAAILGPPAVWAASGHLDTFTDPLVDCRNCHERWRADKIDGVCPNCGSKDLTEARAFNLMFKTHAGPVEDEGHVAYLRPETAQGMFTNFANVLGTSSARGGAGAACRPGCRARGTSACARRASSRTISGHRRAGRSTPSPSARTLSCGRRSSAA
jgi:glycyl-tRNA synthetase